MWMLNRPKGKLFRTVGKFSSFILIFREEILQQMRTFSGGRNTVPQIFFNSDHIGGNDDLVKLDQSGNLIEKITTLKKTPVGMMMDHWYHPWY
jgi:glutaredoxin-related protein